MIERDLTLLVVWSLASGSLILSLLHATAWWILRKQTSQTALGSAINKGELTLGVKNFWRFLFDLLLVVVVTWQVTILGRWWAPWLFFGVTVSIWVAVWYRFRFIIELRRSTPVRTVDQEGVFRVLAASFPIVVTDSAGVIQLTTPAMDRLLGADDTQLLGKNVSTIIPEQWRETHMKGMARYLKTGESRLIGRVVQIDILRIDGTIAPASIALSSAQVEGEPWFIGAMWERTEERFHTPAQTVRDAAQDARGELQAFRQVRQDEQQVVLDETSLINTKRGKYLSESGVVLDIRRVEMNDEREVMNKRGHAQDDRGYAQDDRQVGQDERQIDQDDRQIDQDDRQTEQDQHDRDVEKKNGH